MSSYVIVHSLKKKPPSAGFCFRFRLCLVGRQAVRLSISVDPSVCFDSRASLTPVPPPDFFSFSWHPNNDFACPYVLVARTLVVGGGAGAGTAAAASVVGDAGEKITTTVMRRGSGAYADEAGAREALQKVRQQ